MTNTWVIFTLAALYFFHVTRGTSDVCSMKAEQGMCMAYFPRFYYDVRERACKKFIYGGCGGNGNNFETLDECESACESKMLPPPPPLFRKCGKGFCVFHERCIKSDDTEKCVCSVACPRIYSPVCGTDGKTYFNDCEMRAASCLARKWIFEDHDGKCDKGTTTRNECPPGNPLAMCLVDPCKFAKCSGHPRATCKTNYCGGCNAEFFFGGQKIDDCKVQSRSFLERVSCKNTSKTK